MSTLSVRLAGGRARLAVLACRVTVGGVFAWAAVPKMLDTHTFASDIANYSVVPEPAIGAIAVILPALELVIAVSLLAGIEERGAALLAGALLVAFVAGMAQAMARGIDLSCGCFGSALEARVGWSSILRNIALLAACAFVARAPHAPWRRVHAPG